MLSSEHIKETQILLTAFKQYGYDIKCFKPNYDNYIKIIQFAPSILLMELSTNYSEQIKFISLIRSHPKIKKLPIFAYGYERDAKEINSIMSVGLTKYFQRPLKFTEVLSTIEKLLPEKVKKLKENENALNEEADVKIFIDSEVASSRKLQLLTNHAKSFLAFPFAITRALVVSNDPKSGASELANTIMSDPVISSQILKMSNTVFYARSGERISSIKDAIVRIGFNETRRLVLCVGVMEVFEKSDRTYGFDRKKFWLHSIAVAVITEYLLSRSRFKTYSEFGFLCGLLHDFGTIALDEFLPDLFNDILEDTIDMGGLFSDVFKNKVGFLPQEIAESFFIQWKLPQPIIDSCAYKKKNFENITTKKLEEVLLLSVNVANNIAKSLSLGMSCDQMVMPVSNESVDQLKMTAGLTDVVIDKIYKNIFDIVQFLHIDEKSIQRIKNSKDNMADSEIGYFEIRTQMLPLHFVYLKSVGYKIIGIKELGDLIKFASVGKLIIIYNVDGVKYSHELENVVHKLKDKNIKLLILTNESEGFESDLTFESTQILDIAFDARFIDQKIREILSQK